MANETSLETIIVTASRSPQALSDLAGNTAVINSNTLKHINHTHIQESLARIPGANIARGNGQEYLPSIRSPILTGAGGCGSVLTALDGIPLRAAGFCNINELFDAHTEMAESIEVIRGPGSALFGSNALHGVINIISPRIADQPLSVLAMEFGPNDYSRFKSTLSKPLKNQGVRVDFSATHDGGDRDNSGFDQQKISVRHYYNNDQLEITSSLSFTNLNQETAGYVLGFESYKDSQLKDSNPNPEAYRDAQSARLASQLRYQLNSTSHVTFTPYLRYTKMDFLQHFLPGDPLEENGQKSIGLQSAFHSEASSNLKLIVGFDTEYTDAFLKQSQDKPTQGSAFLQATIPTGKHYDYQINALMLAPFIQTTWQLNPDLSMTAGLRYELMQYDYDNKMRSGRTDENGVQCNFGGCRYSRPEDNKNRFENFSPKLGLLYKLTNQHQLYLNLAYGFRAPQATELYRLQRDQIDTNLDSEQLKSAEIGLRGTTKKARYELIAFAMKKRNAIYRDSDFFNIPEGESTHKGIELAFAYNFNQQWRLNLSGSYAHHRYANNWLLGGINIKGNTIDSAPRHFGSAQLLWRFQQNAQAELEWLHQGSYYTDPENLHSYEGHDTFNLRASWQINKHWKIQTSIINLANKDYAERADYTGFTGDRYFPGKPRSVFLNIQVSW